MILFKRQQYTHRKWLWHESVRNETRQREILRWNTCILCTRESEEKIWQCTSIYFFLSFTICSIQIDLFLTSCIRPIHYLFPQQWLKCVVFVVAGVVFFCFSRIADVCICLPACLSVGTRYKWYSFRVCCWFVFIYLFLILFSLFDIFPFCLFIIIFSAENHLCKIK